MDERTTALSSARAEVAAKIAALKITEKSRGAKDHVSSLIEGLEIALAVMK